MSHPVCDLIAATSLEHFPSKAVQVVVLSSGSNVEGVTTALFKRSVQQRLAPHSCSRSHRAGEGEEAPDASTFVDIDTLATGGGGEWKGYPMCLLRRAAQLVVLPDSTSNGTLRRIAHSLAFALHTEHPTGSQLKDEELVHCVVEGTSVKERCSYYATGGVIVITCRILCSDLLHRRVSHSLIWDVAILLLQDVSLSRGQFSTPSIAFVVEVLLRGGVSHEFGSSGQRRRASPETRTFVVSDHPYLLRFALQRKPSGQESLPRQLHVGDIQVFPRFRLGIVQHFERVARERPLQVEQVSVPLNSSTLMLRDLLVSIRAEVLDELQNAERRLQTSRDASSSGNASSAGETSHANRRVRPAPRDARSNAVPGYVRKPWLIDSNQASDANAQNNSPSHISICFAKVTEEDLDNSSINGLDSLLHSAMRSRTSAVPNGDASSNASWPLRKLAESLLDVQRLLHQLPILSPPAFLLALEDAILRRMPIQPHSKPSLKKRLSPDAPWTLSDKFPSVIVVATHRAYRVTTVGDLLVASSSLVNAKQTFGGVVECGDDEESEALLALGGAEEPVVVPNYEEVDPVLEMLHSLATGWCRRTLHQLRNSRTGARTTDAAPSILISTFNERSLQRLVTRMTHTLDDFQTMELNRFVATYQAMCGTDVREQASHSAHCHENSGRPADFGSGAELCAPNRVAHARTMLFQTHPMRGGGNDAAARESSVGHAGASAEVSERRKRTRAGGVSKTKKEQRKARRARRAVHTADDETGGEGVNGTDTDSTSDESASLKSGSDGDNTSESHGSQPLLELQDSDDDYGDAEGDRAHGGLPSFEQNGGDANENVSGGSRAQWAAFATQGVLLSQMSAAPSFSVARSTSASTTSKASIHQALLTQPPLALPSSRQVKLANCNEANTLEPSLSRNHACEEQLVRDAAVSVDTPDTSQIEKRDGKHDSVIVNTDDDDDDVVVLTPPRGGDVAESAQVRRAKPESPTPRVAGEETPVSIVAPAHEKQKLTLQFDLQSVSDGISILRAHLQPSDGVHMAAHTSERDASAGIPATAFIILVNGRTIGATELLMLVSGEHPLLRSVVGKPGSHDPQLTRPEMRYRATSCNRIILSETNLRFLRLMETLQDALSSDEIRNMRIQVLGSALNAQMRDRTAKEEREAFEGIVHIKASLTGELLFDRVSIQHTRQLLDSGLVDSRGRNQSYTSRLKSLSSARSSLGGAGGEQGMHAANPRIVFDEREFRSTLPYALYCKGIDLIPLTLTNGDYLLSPQYALERKSIPDFTQSLHSGRLHAQLSAMTRKFQHPMCLIEFDGASAFRLCHATPWGTSSESGRMADMYRRIAKLMSSHTTVHFMWARSPNHAAGMLLTLKQTCAAEQVDPASAHLTASGLEGVDEWAVGSNDPRKNNTTTAATREASIQAMRIVSRFPGVTPENVHRVMEASGSLVGLATVSQTTLCNAIGEERGTKLYRFLHNSLFENVE